MKNKLPQLDLSNYKNLEQISSDIEAIILQCVIANRRNLEKTAEDLKLNEDIVKYVAVKYKSNIDEIVRYNSMNNKAQKALDISTVLLLNHVKAIKQDKDIKDEIKLNGYEFTTVTRMVDRLVKIKECNSKMYDTTINKMTDNIIKMKTLELQEKGEVRDDTGYLKNQKTVAKLVSESISFAKKIVKAENVETKEIIYYDSIRSAANVAKLSYIHFGRNIVDSGKPHNGIIYSKVSPEEAYDAAEK